MSWHEASVNADDQPYPPPPPAIKLTPRRPGAIVPLTAEQLRLWAIHARDCNSLSYRVCAYIARIPEGLDIGRLSHSIDALVQRHEALRMRLCVDQGGLRQVIEMPRAGHLRFCDLRLVVSTTAEFTRHLNQFLQEQVDLTRGPLFAAQLWALSDHEHVLCVAVDHMVCDSASHRILIRDLWRIYSCAEIATPMTRLPEPALQFGDYAVWREQRYLVWKDRHDPYWAQRLAGAICLRIAGETADSTANAVHDMQYFAWGKSLITGLSAIAERQALTVHVIALSLYILAMSTWCNERRLICPVVLHGRQGCPELRDSIGFFAGEAYMPIDIDENQSAVEFAHRVSAEFKSITQCQDLGRVPDIVAGCSPEVAFNWQKMDPGQGQPLDSPCAGRITAKPALVSGAFLPETVAPFFYEERDCVTLIIHYRPNLVSSRSVKRFGTHLRVMAETFLERSDVLVGSLLRCGSNIAL